MVEEGTPRLSKRHFWAHVQPKGRWVNYDVLSIVGDGSDPVSNESSNDHDPEDNDVWIRVKKNQSE